MRTREQTIAACSALAGLLLAGCAGDADSAAARPAPVPNERRAPSPPPPAPATIGAEAARNDIAAGRLALRTYGLNPSPPALGARLRRELGVELVESGNCVLMPQQLEEIEAYNREMKAEIARRFGPGTLERLRDEAEPRPSSGPTP
jgi:hypothetical protein